MTWMKFIGNLVVIMALTNCAQYGAKRKIHVPAGEPEWIYSPSTLCESSGEICASGEGISFKQSDAFARKSLASIFETKINSSFKFTKHSFSDSEINEMSEIVSNKVDEDVSGILKGATIKERFKKDKLMFSLAALNKLQAQKILGVELARIDEEMGHYYKQRNRLLLKKLNVLYNQRELLNEKLVIITGSLSPSPISLSQINMLKFKSKGGAKVQIKALTEVPGILIKKIEQTMTEIGYKINRKNDNNYILNLSFKEKEEYLNVTGFKRWMFELVVDSRNNTGKRLGGFVISKVSDGRNKKDAFSKVRNKIYKEFEQNLEKLNFK